MIKRFFIPTEKNNYTPYLLSKVALVGYIVVFLIFTLFAGQVPPQLAKADITITQIVEEHNRIRRQNGLPTLNINTVLRTSAQRKAEAMMQTNCWSHFCPNGKDWRDYFTESGYVYQHAGENLAEGFKLTESMMNAWMNSPTHRSNILNGNFNDIGIGVVTGNFQGTENNMLVVVHFGKPFTEGALTQASTENDIKGLQESLGQDDFVQITSPRDGEVLRANMLRIAGIVSFEDANIEVYLNDSRVGRVNALGFNYDYRSQTVYADGLYRLQARALDADENVRSVSQPISVIMDQDQPIVAQESILVYRSEDKIILTFMASSDVAKVTSTAKTESAIKEVPDSWKLTFTDSEINAVQNSYIEVAAEDYIGQKAIFFIDKSDLLNAGELGGQAVDSVIDQSIPVYFVQRIESEGLKAALPSVFAAYLILLFIVDYVMLAKTNMLKDSKRRHSLNIGLLVVIVILAVAGGVSSGNILVGLSS